MNRSDNELLAVVNAHIEAEQQAFTISKLMCAILVAGLLVMGIFVALSFSTSVAMA